MRIMRNSMRWAASILIASGAFLASSVYAQTFDLRLGNKTLGTLTYSTSTKGEQLLSSMNNTPLGVFNGTFTGSSSPVQASSGRAAQQYQSLSKSSRKTRQIMVTIEDGRVIKTNIDPTSERTDLSKPNAVPRGVIDPVQAMGRLIQAQGCPKQFMLYDGRRAVRLTPVGSGNQGTLLTCAVQYNVIAGPGHLSPLYISSVKMQVKYEGMGDQQRLVQIHLKSGIFNLFLTLRN